ncbi:MAG TPA: BCAM0308 family protein [Burkholderiales bacterium]|nr:BCAM0308 family protein [Burkholderiales bacterium]
MKTVRDGFRMLRHEQLLQEVVHDTYKLPRKLAEPTRCPDCGAVWRDGRWAWSAGGGPAHEARCPACQRIRDNFPAGFVSVSGEFFAGHRDEILALVRHCEENEKRNHPLERVMKIADDTSGVLVTTTGVHLARRLGEALEDAYKGVLEYHYNKEQQLLRVAWNR